MSDICNASDYDPQGEPWAVVAARATLSASLNRFVAGARLRGNAQRGAAWYASLGTTVGGSNIGGILGRGGSGAYSATFASVARGLALARLGAAPPRGAGGPATWWGQLFEDVLAVVVGADLGSAVVGDDICIQAFAGHRTSPDGFIVARLLAPAAPGEPARLWTTADAEPAVAARVLVLEFKCPVSRRPAAGEVPAEYAAQVQSGLLVSPLAAGGLFVDAVFRRAAAADLGPSPAYADDSQAARDAADGAEWLGRGAFAWGVAALVADNAAGIAAYHAALAADPWADADVGAALPVDAGAVPRVVFDRLLGATAAGRLRAVPGGVEFADGRRAPAPVDAPAMWRAGGPLPAVVATVGWKLFQLEYVPVEREPGFARRALAALADVHALASRAAAAARAAGWPAPGTAGWIGARGNTGSGGAPPAPVSTAARAALEAVLVSEPRARSAAVPDFDMLESIGARLTEFSRGNTI